MSLIVARNGEKFPNPGTGWGILGDNCLLWGSNGSQKYSRVLVDMQHFSIYSMAKKISTRKIMADNVARVLEWMLGLGVETRQFRAALEACQSEIRRTLVQLGDATEQNTEGATP